MLRKYLLIAILLSLAWQGDTGAAEMELKPKLACLPFVFLNVEAMAIAENLSSILVNSIDRSGYFETVERRKLESSIELAGLTINKMTREDLFQLGRSTGLDFLVCGTVKRTGDGMAVNIQLLSIRTAKVYYADTFQITEHEIVNRMQKVTTDLITKTKECMLEGRTGGGKGRPAPPTELEAIGTSSKIRLKWLHADCSPAVVFKIYRASTENGPYIHIATSPDPSYTDEQLRVNETFYYRIKASNPRGVESEFSTTVTGVTALAPLPPIFLNIEADVKGAVLSWRPRPNDQRDDRQVVAEFKIYRKGDGEKTFTERARCSKEEITYRDSGLEDTRRYTYAVISVNRYGTESEFSTTLDVRSIPVIDGLRVTRVQKRLITLQWAPPPYKRIAGYTVYRSEQAENGYGKIARIEGNDRTSYTDLAPESSKTYWYRLAAFNSINSETVPGLPVQATTMGKLPVPTGISAIGGQMRKISLYWQPVGSPADEITGYQIYRAEEEKGSYGKIGEVSAKVTTFTDDEKPLMDSTTYYYRICSRDAEGDLSPLSAPVMATTKAGPIAPVDLSAKSDEIRQVTLSWKPNPEPDVIKYEIFRGPANESVVTLIDSVAGTSYVDNGLADNFTYNYAIKAVNREGMTSGISKAAKAQTRSLPKKPAGIRISEENGRLLITWNPSDERDIRWYNIYRQGFMGLSQKLATVEKNSYQLEEARKDEDLVITAQDENGRESEGTQIILPR